MVFLAAEKPERPGQAGSGVTPRLQPRNSRVQDPKAFIGPQESGEDSASLRRADEQRVEREAFDEGGRDDQQVALDKHRCLLK
jgi:hypothetical protein